MAKIRPNAVFCVARGLQRLSPVTLKTSSKCRTVQAAHCSWQRGWGFSVRYARPVPYNSATPEEQEEYVTKTIEILKKYSRKRYKAVWVDAAAFVDAPSSTRGLRAIGGKDTVQINFSKKSTKIIGALGQGTLDIQFYQKIDADSVIAFLEYLRCMYGRVLVILDNAGAHTSKQVKGYIESTKGDVVLWFLPPRTPQHNPIEIQWREIRRAVAGIFFGGLDELQKRIRQLLDSEGGAHSQTVWIYARGPQKSKRAMAPSTNHTCRSCNHTTVINIHKIPVH